MSLRFFADQCVSNRTLQALREAGGDALRLRDFIPPDSPDRIVISKAQQLDCILVSLDGDFADIVTYPPASYEGIIAIQLHDHPEIEPHLLARLCGYLAAHPDPAHYKGKLIIVEVHRIRIRE